MKVIRILIYEGKKEWVRSSLDSKRAVVGEFTAINGTIKEFYLASPLSFLSLPPLDIEEKK